jgi:hypothetical protein
MLNGPTLDNQPLRDPNLRKQLDSGGCLIPASGPATAAKKGL